MKLNHLYKAISSWHLPFGVMKSWEIALREEYEPLKTYFRPMDRLAQRFPGRTEWESYRIVVHKDGTIVGIDDEDYENRIELTRTDILLYRFDYDRFRRESSETLGLHRIESAIPDAPRALPLGFWEPEKGSQFPVYIMLPGALNLREKIMERIVEKEADGEILLVPPRSQSNDTLERAAKKNNILLVPVDEVLCLKDGRISATPQWGDYLLAFSQMVGTTLPSRYQKPVRDYVFARRGDEWFLQYGEKTSTLEPELLGPLFIQYLLKYPNQKIPAKQLWLEVMKPSGPKTKMNDDVAALNSLLSDGEEILDRAAKEKYRKRLMELSQERIEATECNDCGELARINTEFEKIQSVLESAQGFGGHSQKIGSDVKKIANRIRQLLLRVFKKLDKTNPNLSQYLKNSIKYGASFQYISYDEVVWKFE